MLLQDSQKRDEETVGSMAGVKPCSQCVYSASFSAKVIREKSLKGLNRTKHWMQTIFKSSLLLKVSFKSVLSIALW